jgi:outer membrane biosynthesis protein TonB
MMKKAREFNNILDECLERVLVEGDTIEQCLAGYPEYAAELEPLLRTALDTKKAVAIKPRPEFRERARHQFQAALREMEPKRSRDFFFSLKPRWATVLVVVVVLLLGGGTVTAANNSMPDEPLYPVKLATEVVRLTLSPSALGKAELYVKLADKRVNEIIRMADKGKAEQVEKATGKLDEYLIAMSNLATHDGVKISQVQETEQPMLAVPQEVPQPQATPTAPAPAMAPSPTPPPVIEVAPQAPVEEAPVSAAPKAPALSENARLGNGGSRDNVGKTNQAGLRQALSRKAAENLEALQAVLEKAPESVKPALRRAIEVADSGYGTALRSLD